MMKSPRNLPLLTILILLLIQLSSCKKIIDKIYKEHHPGIEGCKITRIVDHTEEKTYDFTYNSAGNPVSILNNNVSTGSPNYFFKYDENNRLTDFMGFYENGSFEVWSRYGYDDQNRIVKDTMYVFGVIDSFPDPDSYFITIHTYTYDAQGRMIMDEADPVQPDDEIPYTDEFTYDADGNLETGTVYDNKVNLNRTNKIWMFLSRDYSVNNRLPATSYNSRGLPLGFSQPTNWAAFNIPINQSTITYSCP